jgi:hypothetical protein
VSSRLLGFGKKHSPQNQTQDAWSPLHHALWLEFPPGGRGSSQEESSDISYECTSICTPELWGISGTPFR